MEIKSKAISGAKWTTFSSIFRAVEQLLQIVILARFFLSPADFGLMAMVQVIIGFAQAFMDMGISNAIIYKQNITHTQLSSLYWLNITSGFILFIILSVLSPLIAHFYHEDKLISLIIITSISFLIIPIGQQFQILLQKELEFEKLAKIDIISFAIELIVSILFAFWGFGVYSIIIALLSMSGIRSSILLLTGHKTHKPALIYRHKELKGFFSFGMYQVGEKTINYFNSQFDIIIIGKLLGPEALGIYTIAKSLVIKPALLINQVVTKITFPVMAKLQNNDNALKEIYLKTSNILSSINSPIYVAIAVMAEPIVNIMFGSKWLASVPILQILSFYALIRSTGNPVGSLLLAKGKADLGFYWNLGLFIFIPVTIYFGSNWGLIGVSLALLSLQISLLIPSWYFLVNKLCHAKFIEYHLSIIFPFIISILSGLIAYYAQNYISDMIQKLTLGILSGLLSYVLFSYLFNRDLLLSLKSIKNK